MSWMFLLAVLAGLGFLALTFGVLVSLFRAASPPPSSSEESTPKPDPEAGPTGK